MVFVGVLSVVAKHFLNPCEHKYFNYLFSFSWWVPVYLGVLFVVDKS